MLGYRFLSLIVPTMIFLTPGVCQPKLTALGNSGDYFNRVAPGELATLFGSNLSSRELQASTIPLPKQLGDVQVSGCSSLPGFGMTCDAFELLYVGPTQINLKFPNTLAQVGSAHTFYQMIVVKNSAGQVSMTLGPAGGSPYTLL
jgi:uncharacterized protein (TIGR03437 family)